MDKFLEAALKAFESFAKFSGISDKAVITIKAAVTVSIAMIIGIALIIKIFKYFIDQRNKKILNRDLAPYFSYSDVLRARKLYIKTKHQSVAPSIDEEPGGKFITTPKAELMPEFMGKIFKRSYTGNKFYLVLADSGMGKTTFMINLYVQYKNRIIWPFSAPGFDIKLFPLGAKDILETINKIEKKSETILLLDAFDEDISAIVDYQKRINQILEVVSKFRTVVISCRTQFFPTQKEEPYETGYMTFGGDDEHKFEKSYLSVFNEKDINKYLGRKFGFFKFQQRANAKKIVDQCPNLMVRPMLLSYIDDLVHEFRPIKFTYEVYAILIHQWVVRESKKPAVKDKYYNPENYQILLQNFSQKLARNLFDNAKKRNGYHISKDTKFGIEGLSINTLENQALTLSEGDGRHRSLLNRDASGNYKFSHKSIFEYFLAKELIIDQGLAYSFQFRGLDMCYIFHKEMITTLLNESDGLAMGNIPFTSISNVKENLTLDTFLIWDDHFDLLRLSAIKNSLTIYSTNRICIFMHYINNLIICQEDISAIIHLLKEKKLDNILEFIRSKKCLDVLLQNTISNDILLLKSGDKATGLFYKVGVYSKENNSINTPFLITHSDKLESIYLEYYNPLHRRGEIDTVKSLHGLSHSIDIQRMITGLETKIKFNRITNTEIFIDILNSQDVDIRNKILDPLDIFLKKVNTLRIKNNHTNRVAIPIQIAS